MISPDQTPIGSGFGPATTAAEAVHGIDLRGRVAVVTGGYSGIGLETTRALAEAGATVIVPARDRARAAAALAGLDRVEMEALDLTDAASVAAFARRFCGSGRLLSMLVNSAGIMATPLHRDADGREGQFATNHLGHFRLTLALWPALLAAGREAGGARVVSVSSRGHQIAGVDFDDLDFERRPYDKWIAYGQSKTANALFTVALDRRGRNHGVRAFSLHPGQILTELSRHLSAEEIAGFDALDAEGRPRIDPSRGMKTVAQGAATSVWCATSPRLDGLGGVYCEDCDVAPVYSAATGRRGVHPWAAEDALAERLWRVSEALAGASLP
ncbi:SDR family NAD(P)-dependent oxidoreductase [Azospirillum sp. YIM DDC1]|uniref:SDR family NAD(P)-dependent oxidoreductase n=1 Tax=Azospirillum aestuarii TaxID=2802052 RepID=A0ABS1I990_9PROT|nr:oxidoreductase [Azospirillum aestuarii]MBK4723263.1 SDR family NAD(P)-dependent oxidoreductase [Azospirillum aestuarii]